MRCNFLIPIPNNNKKHGGRSGCKCIWRCIRLVERRAKKGAFAWEETYYEEWKYTYSIFPEQGCWGVLRLYSASDPVHGKEKYWVQWTLDLIYSPSLPCLSAERLTFFLMGKSQEGVRFNPVLLPKSSCHEFKTALFFPSFLLLLRGWWDWSFQGTKKGENAWGNQKSQSPRPSPVERLWPESAALWSLSRARVKRGAVCYVDHH